MAELRFVYALAAHLKATACDLCDRLGPDEWATWRAIYEVEGFGERAADLRAAMIAHTVANFAGKSAADTIPMTSFLPDPWADEETVEIDVDHQVRCRMGLLMSSQ